MHRPPRRDECSHWFFDVCLSLFCLFPASPVNHSRSKMPAAEHDIPTKIFLGNLALETDEKKLREVFSKMGPIEQSK